MNDLMILTALRERCEEITLANGYDSDAGTRIYTGSILDEATDTLPALVITQPPDDSDLVNEDSGEGYLRWDSRFIVGGYTECDKDDPFAALSPLANDIRRAVYRPSDPTLEGVATDVRLIGINKQTPLAGSTIGVVQVILLVQHIEEY